MQPTALAVLALAAWAALRPSAAILPMASSCCTAVSHHVPRRLLDRVSACRLQRADGDCDLAAVILHVGRRRVCASPHGRAVKRWMRTQAAGRHGPGHGHGPVCRGRRRHGRRHSPGAPPGSPGSPGSVPGSPGSPASPISPGSPGSPISPGSPGSVPGSVPAGL